MPSIQPEYYLVLGGVVAIFLVLFVVLAYRTMKNPWLRRETPVQAPQATETTELAAPSHDLPTSWTNTDEIADAARTTLRQTGIPHVLDLVCAMAGFGPTVNTPSVRDAAVDIMQPDLYGTFLRTFRVAAQIPERIVFDARPLDELTGCDIAQIADRDEMLAFLVMYAPHIRQFYIAEARRPVIAEHLTSAIIMGPQLDNLLAIHHKFYA